MTMTRPIRAGRLRFAARLAAGLAAMATAGAAATVLVQVTPASADAPVVTNSWYMYGTTQSALDTNAYNDAQTFAGQIPKDWTKYLVLDFGAPVSTGGGGFGAIDFSNTVFSNGAILTALENAADGLHHGGPAGKGIITFGNSNYSEGLSYSQYHDVGLYQEQRAADLAAYQSQHGYVDQGAAAASDMEPGFNSYAITKGLVDGATAANDGPYLDYGSADGCPQSGTGGNCNNGWTVYDVGYVSYSGVALSMPEIYYVPANSNQWTVVRRTWGSGYNFLGVTGSPPTSNAQAGWNALDGDNPGLVGRNLICFGC